jgi:hypothetical protein
VGTIGIEWVRCYHGKAPDLKHTRTNAEGFYNALSATRHFAWGDDLAWDQDFEQENLGSPPSGTDSVWVDNVDMVYFAGHGTESSFIFGVPIDDMEAKASEIRWGDGRLKWIVLDACDVLWQNDGLDRTGAIDRWGWPVFNGLHYILGFDTIANDNETRGRLVAQYLNAGSTVRQAWIKACQDTEPSHVKWAYLRADDEGSDTYNDHWLGKGSVSADPREPTAFYYARGAC